MTDIARLKDLDNWFETAREAARRAGECLLEGSRGAKQVTYKGRADIVTNVDLKSQEIIMETILERFPDHSILSEEEGGQVKGSGGPLWIIDPLDGTTNFAHNFPCVGISIALEVEGTLALGVIFNPFHNEFYSACLGRGAKLNGQPITVSKNDTVRESLIGTGFPYDIESQLEEVKPRFFRLILAAQGVRRPGAAAVDLGYVAGGMFDGFWEQDLKPWDMAAGCAIIREAGGKVTRFDGGPFDLRGVEILATNGLIHDEMVELLKL